MHVFRLDIAHTQPSAPLSIIHYLRRDSVRLTWRNLSTVSATSTAYSAPHTVTTYIVLISMKISKVGCDQAPRSLVSRLCGRPRCYTHQRSSTADRRHQKPLHSLSHVTR